MNYQELRDEIKAAMKAKDKARLAILRQVLGEIKNIEVNERREITDADVDAMLKRTIKQTKETLDGSIKAGNDQDRTDTLTEQVKILEEYLPKQVSGEELSALIGEVLAETGATTKKEMGRVMGALTQKTGGNFDKAQLRKSFRAVWHSHAGLREKTGSISHIPTQRREPCLRNSRKQGSLFVHNTQVGKWDLPLFPSLVRDDLS